MKKFLILGIIILAVVALFSFKDTSNNSLPVTQSLTNNPSPEISTNEAVTLALNKKYNKPEGSFIVDVTVDTGTFAKGYVREKDEMGGGLWFAAKTAKGWELAFDGNGIITCDVVDKYNFPTDMIPECFDPSNGGNLVKR